MLEDLTSWKIIFLPSDVWFQLNGLISNYKMFGVIW